MQTPTIGGRLAVRLRSWATKTPMLKSFVSVSVFFFSRCLRSLVFAYKCEQCDLCAPSSAIRRLIARAQAKKMNESFKIFTFHSFQLLAEGTCHRFFFVNFGSFSSWPRLEDWRMVVCQKQVVHISKPNLWKERKNVQEKTLSQFTLALAKRASEFFPAYFCFSPFRYSVFFFVLVMTRLARDLYVKIEGGKERERVRTHKTQRRDEVVQKVTDLKFTTSFSLGFSNPPSPPSPRIRRHTHKHTVETYFPATSIGC